MTSVIGSKAYRAETKARQNEILGALTLEAFNKSFTGRNAQGLSAGKVLDLRVVEDVIERSRVGL